MNNIHHQEMVKEAVRPKFYGHKAIKSKTVPLYPKSAEREFQRIAGAYMKLLNQELKKKLPAMMAEYKRERHGDSRFDDSRDLDSKLRRLLQEVADALEQRIATFGLDEKVKKIAELAIEYLKDDMLAAKSFKAEAKRSDKSFPMTSIELAQFVGGELAEAYPNCEVDVHNPELTVHIEVRDLAAYVHAAPTPGAGGMPVGANGVAVTLLSGGIDSPVSTYMIAKRGVRLIPVHFFSFPYTSEQAKQKVIELARLLTVYCGRMTIEVVPFTHIQEEIRAKCDEDYFTLIMRRFMMRIAQKIADANGAKAIVTGENLGQVASQTMEAMASTQAVTDLPVLQPLIGMDKEEIVRLARKIGTFETSILPYEDCCTVFTPKHPKTKPKLRDVEQIESALDIDALVEEAYAGIERIKVGD